MRLARIPLLLVLIVFGNASLVRSQSPLGKPFEATYEQLVEAFKPQPSKSDPSGREILLYNVSYNFDDKGLLSKSTHMIWKLRQTVVADHGTIESEYSPWYEKQPVIRARVFDRTGKVYEFAKEDSTVAPAESYDPRLFTNDQVVRAALPGLQEGAIVEQVVIEEEHAPFFADGRYYTEVLDVFQPVRFHSVEISSPLSIPLELFFLSSDFPVEKSSSDGRVLRRIELSGREPIDFDKFEDYAPRGVGNLSQVGICLGESWEKVASGYSRVIDRKLEEMQFSPLLKEIIPADAKSKLEKLQASILWIKQNIRYTGIALGDASIVPATPMQLIARRFGDCKDQSTFLVGMLRAQGIDSHVVLVNATNKFFPHDKLVGLNAFNHAIVVANLDDKQYWIDCTSQGSTIYSVPNYLQGKFALIAAENQSLTQIPSSPADVNYRSDEKEILIQPSRTLKIRSSETYSGLQAVSVREVAMTETKEETEKKMSEVLQRENPEATFRIIQQDDPWSQEPTFHKVTELNELPLEEINYSTLRYVFYLGRLFELLPQVYAMYPREDGTPVSRVHPAEVNTAFTNRRVYNVQANDRWSIQAKIGKQSSKIGGVELLRQITRNDDGSLTAVLEVRVEPCVLSVDQLRQLSEVVKSLDDPTDDWNVSIVFREKSTAEGQTPLNAVQKAKANWEAKKTGEVLLEYVTNLIEFGLADEARRVASKAVEDHPHDANVYLAKAISFLVDLAGREVCPGADRGEAKKALLEANRLDPKNLQVYHHLTALAYFDLDATNPNKVEGAEKCLKVIAECEAATGSTTLGMRDLHILSLATLDRIPDAITVAENYRADRMSIGLQCYESVRNSRWNEVKRFSEQIGSNRELRAAVTDLVRGLLVDRRLFSPAADFLEAFADSQTKKQAERTAEYLRNLKPAEVDKDPTASPSRVANELVQRIHLFGAYCERWGDIIDNPTSPCPEIEDLAGSPLVADYRELFRTKLASREGVARTIVPSFTVEGDDQSGYQCRIDKGTVTAWFFVLKRGDQYKILLPGPRGEHLVEQAKKLASDSNYDAAAKWINWCLDYHPEASFLDPESGLPVKTLWTLNRKKTPEAIEMAIKMMTPWEGNIPEKQAEVLAWIDAEKNKSRQIQLWRYMLDSLRYEHAPEYNEQAKKFVQAHPQFTRTRFQFILRLLEDGDIDEAEKVYREGASHFSPMMRAEAQRRFNQARGEFSKNVAEAKKKLEKNAQLDEWNSFLWEALFAGELEKETVKEAAQSIRRLREPSCLHTLACAEAKVGLVKEAVEDLRLLMRMQGEKMAPVDWLIVGLIAEDCKLWDAAVNAYEKVEKQPQTVSMVSSYRFAQQRIQAIKDRPDQLK